MCVNVAFLYSGTQIEWYIQKFARFLMGTGQQLAALRNPAQKYVCVCMLYITGPYRLWLMLQCPQVCLIKITVALSTPLL